MLRKILAVDDSALIHQMYKLFLSRYKNCKLVSAMNGLEALDKLAQEEGDRPHPPRHQHAGHERPGVPAAGPEGSRPTRTSRSSSSPPRARKRTRSGASRWGPRATSRSLSRPRSSTASSRRSPALEPLRSARLTLMEFEVSAELVGIYLEDAREHLALLDDALLRLEREGHDPEIAASLLGPLHTLKGNSGMIGFPAVKDYVHRLEDVFARARDGTLALDAGRLRPPAAGGDRAARRRRVGVRRGPGDVRDLAPETAALVALARVDLRGPRRRPEPAAAAAPAPRPAPARRPTTPPVAPARSTMVRVDFARLDHLLNLVGELIVYRTKLQELARQIADARPPAARAASCSTAVHQVAGVSHPAPGDDHGRADAPHPPRLRALPAPRARPRATAGQGGGAHPRGRGHPGRQGDHRRDRRAARPPDPQRGGPRHRAARERAPRAASRRPAPSCSRPPRSRTRS